MAWRISHAANRRDQVEPYAGAASPPCGFDEGCEPKPAIAVDRGNPRRLSAAQQVELAGIVETGPDLAVDDVVRWRRIDLQRVIEERFGIACHERTIGKLLTALGFSHISARPRHPKQDGEVEAFKRTSPHARSASRWRDAQEEDRDLVPGW